MPHARRCTCIATRTPSPRTPSPLVIIGVGANSVVASAHATCAGAYGEVDVVADGTHAAGGVAAAEWLAATLGGGDVNAGGPGARNSAVVNGVCPGSEGRDTSASPSSYLLTVHDNDDFFSPFRMPLLVAAATAKILMVSIVTLSMLVCTMTYRMTMMTTTRRTSSK